MTIHLLAGPQHHVVPTFSHLVKLLSLLFHRITLYDYQAMCRANKESSDGAHGLLDVSTVQSLRRQLCVLSCLCVCAHSFPWTHQVDLFQNNEDLNVFPDFIAKEKLFLLNPNPVISGI